jgi:tripartite ATP-independent transporter DctP family solute receptor
VLLLAACGGDDTEPADSASSANGGGKKIELRIGHALSDKHPQDAGAQKFAELVEEKSGGRITAKVFANGQLGDDVALQEQVATGALDMAVPGNTLSLAPKTGIFLLPGLFADKEEARNAFSSDLARKIFNDELVPKGIRTLAIFDGGFRSVTNSVRAIKSLDQFDGLKIRAPAAPLYVDTINALGASATPLDFAELFTALDQGTVDGQENPPILIESSKLYDVQKYLTLTNHMAQAQPLVISEKVWGDLDSEAQKILAEAAIEAQTYNYGVVDTATDDAMAKLKEQGMEVTEIPFEEVKAATKPVFDKYVADFGADLVEQVQAAAKGS